MNTFTITQITPDRYASLLVQADKKLGSIQSTGNTGSGSGDGVTMSWVYTPETDTATFTVVKKPFFVGLDLIETHVRQWASA